ncbi:copper resistance protein NlpE [Hymenobacter sp. RP-2-7]|uniref:Copper resistance protein NlpE n=1 Tax=Hymenobacter polaris TaxID=2682546 RepID=A0A7Y0AAT3_9BACT|nr:hypothetical protein [Hymenobacter polaris]NML63767.1 copper resistance protein NlpE [Hymenobacter polaris]
MLFLRLLALGPLAALGGQPARPPVAFYTTYSYVGYTVYDFTEGQSPTQVPGVGGTLTLRADGSYTKRLSLLLGDSGPRYFSQQGRFTTQGDSIFFRFSDKNGPDVQRGTFRYEPASKKLSISLMGYPRGNHGDYELLALPAARRP